MSFRLIVEIEPPRVPDLDKVVRQIEMFGPLVDAILVPDNHLGLPALSSIAIALEVKKRGYEPVVALNARDRNPLRTRSDFITLRAYGVEEVLLLGGDRVEGAAPGTTVKGMLDDEAGAGLTRGVIASIGKPPVWRRRADFLFTKLAFGRAGIADWRGSEGLTQPVYCGVIAFADQSVARKVLDKLPDLNAPPGYLERFDSDDEAGLRIAIDELESLRSNGADGAHLVIPTGRKKFIRLLEEWLPAARKDSM